MLSKFLLNVTASNRKFCDLTGTFVWCFPTPNQNSGYAPGVDQLLPPSLKQILAARLHKIILIYNW